MVDTTAAARPIRTTIQSDGVDAATRLFDANDHEKTREGRLARRRFADHEHWTAVTLFRSDLVHNGRERVGLRRRALHLPRSSRDRAEIEPRSSRDQMPRSSRDRAEARAHARLQPDALAHDVEALAREGVDNEGVVRAHPADVPAAMRPRLDVAAWSVFCDLCGSSVNCNLESFIYRL